ncbi:GTPase HflX [Anaerosinus sp.]|uniref:GTPase HflX n=1 Tax=Selenobaculum sp. TaxID=3074374 RepID=UPI0015A80AEC
MDDIYGDTDGIKKSILDNLKTLYQMTIPSYQIITADLARSLLDFTRQLNKEIAIYVNRRGNIIKIAIGGIKNVSLPEIRVSNRKLSGVRCIHTHPNGESDLSSHDISALKHLKFDVMAAIADDSQNNIIVSIAFLTGECEERDSFIVEEIKSLSISAIERLDLKYLITIIDNRLLNQSNLIDLNFSERAILVGLETKNKKMHWSINDSLHELSQLAETAGADVISQIQQKRDLPDSALFLGKGKIEELLLLIQDIQATLVIFDDELSPSQQRNIENILNIKVLDRTALILDIFAQRARSFEGKLQVELAQMQYRLPRIGGQGLILSRLGGGIGTRGPGETKLEVDKRKIRSRITEIERQISLIKKQRSLQRENRSKSNTPTVALVGYTNAGKSTLLNLLTNANVFAENKLFATLDPTTRKLNLANVKTVLLTDTVGFIQKLPHQLISAFRATLEEVQEADLLLHVVDCSHPNYLEQINSVMSVLSELNVDDKPMILVYNKCDKLSSIPTYPKENELYISAKNRIGIDSLLKQIEEFFLQQHLELELLIPYNESALISQLHEIAVVQKIEYVELGNLVQVSIPSEYLAKYEKYKNI